MDALDQNVCRSRSRRSEKDLRINPSKLTKRELEDHYFTLIQSNTELKRTVNVQMEQLRALSTKLLRVNSAPRRHLCTTTTHCCTNAHQVIHEQKSVIHDLEQANIRFTGKIRLLNMKLSSQKQFTKNNPSRTASKYRILSASASRKSLERAESFAPSNISSTVSATDRSQKDCESNDSDPKTVIDNDIETVKKDCDQNKCQTQINELKQTVVNLQEELSAARVAASADKERIVTLEGEVGRVRAEVAGAARGALREHRARLHQLTAQLRRSQGAANSLNAELAIEKKKVIELNAELKAAATTKTMVNVLEDRLMHVTKTENDLTAALHEFEHSNLKTVQPAVAKYSDNETQLVHNIQTPLKNITDSLPELKNILSTYVNEDMGSVEIIKQLMKKISILQSELDVLKVSQTTNKFNSSLLKHVDATDDADSVISDLIEPPGDTVITKTSETAAAYNPCVGSAHSDEHFSTIVNNSKQTSGERMEEMKKQSIAEASTIINAVNNVNKMEPHKSNLSKEILQSKKSSEINPEPNTGTISPDLLIHNNNKSSSSNKTFIVEVEVEAERRPVSPSSSNTERNVASIEDTCERDGESLSLDDPLKLSQTEDSSIEYSSYSDSFGTTVNVFSDGEVPTGRDTKSALTLNGKDITSAEPVKTSGRLGSTSFQVEEALRAITVELSKCQALLQPRKKNR